MIYSGTSRNLAVEITGSILGGGLGDGGDAGVKVSFTESGTNCELTSVMLRVYGGGGMAEMVVMEEVVVMVV